MPQTTANSIKSDAFPVGQASNRFRKGITSVSRVERNWPRRCISRHQLHSASARCHQQRPNLRDPSIRAACKIPSSPKNLNNKNQSGTTTCPSTFRMPLTSSCRKSLSMIELSPARTDHEVIHLNRLDDNASLARMGQIVGRTMELSCFSSESKPNLWINTELGGGGDDVVLELNFGRKAAVLVCHALALNAWRRRREEVVELRRTIDHLSQQVDQLQLQIVVLRRLLDTENNRVSKLGAEVHRAKAQLENTLKEKNNLSAANDKLNAVTKKMSDMSDEREVALENLKNDLLSMKRQLEALDEQIARDRAKLLKLREDKKILLEKVATSESLAHEREAQVKKVETSFKELQDSLGIQMDIINTLHCEKQQLHRDLKAAEIKKLKLKKRLSANEDLAKASNLRTTNLEIQLSNRDAALRKIEVVYNSQLDEMSVLKERLLRQSEDVNWSSRVLQIAGILVQAPRAILRTLLFFSPNSASSHP